MIKIQESAQNTFHDIEELDETTKNLLLSKQCINCSKHMKDGQKIDYIVFSDKKISWWHHRDDNLTNCANYN